MAESRESNPIIEAVVDAVRRTLDGATDAEIELVNSGISRVVDNGKLQGFADSGERTMQIRFVVPGRAKSVAEARLEMERSGKRMKLITPDEVEEEIKSDFNGFSEFKLKGIRNG